jgi:hypothetical protein
LLKLPANPTESSVKQAFFMFAMTCHPDVNKSMPADEAHAQFVQGQLEYEEVLALVRMGVTPVGAGGPQAQPRPRYDELIRIRACTLPPYAVHAHAQR